MQSTLNDQSYPLAKQQIEAAAVAYYDADGSTSLLMSDAEYDALLASVADYEQRNSITDGASSAVAGGARLTGDVEHSHPMLSLDNVFSSAELDQFLGRAADLGRVDRHRNVFCVDPKLDGLALSIRYEQGVAVQMVTRGDGTKGEDVTYALPLLTNLPDGLPSDFTGEVRGEALFSRLQFHLANAVRVEHGDKPFVNARNGAAGALRGARSRDYAIEMSFVAYERVRDETDQSGITSFCQAMASLESLGFTTARDVLVRSGLTNAQLNLSDNEVLHLVTQIEQIRNELPFETDGAVIKLDSFAARERAGAGSKSPRWAIAYKYPAQEVTSILEEVIWQVGRTGVITPRARIAPVECSGTVITYATLHNVADMSRKDFMIGDTVLVKRAGEVIPRLEGVLTARRTGKEQPVPIPTQCPRCNGPIDTSQERWRCLKGRRCGIAEALVYAVSRDALDVEGLGKVQINNLVDSGKVADLADLFDLTEQDLVTFGKLAPKNAVKVFEGLDAALRAPFERVVIALGLKGAGRSGGRALAREFGSMQAILAASVDDLAKMVVSVNRLGLNKAEDVRTDLDDLVEAGVIDRLDKAGMTMELSSSTAARSTSSDASASTDDGDLPLTGMAVCVTGTMVNRSRGEMEELVVALGGRPASSVSKNTSLLVAGPGAGSKLAKAQQLGVPVLDEAEFLAKYAG